MTLVELMVVVLIAAILATIAVPAYQNMHKTQTVDAMASVLTESLQFARSEALRRNARVVVCASTDADATAPSCRAEGDWSEGWIVFLDADADGTLADGDRVLKVHSVLGMGTEATDLDDQLAMTFLPNGMVLATEAAIAADRNAVHGLKVSPFTDDAADYQRVVCVTRAGRIEAKSGTHAC
ncbi:hypothetical protein G3A44_11080 [Ideonella sp. TBM-1]|uniref:Type II secretion system protein H n=2 Tax=Ideonella livida TaxID=2707176 RepID=A0A7C9PHC3_9BURK|nr:hypothetical protein [Ideonella livida]